MTAANGILKNDSDGDGNALTAVLVAGPAHGELTLQSNGSFVYRPHANYFGADSFTYRASDGGLTSDVATVNISVGGVNDAPIAVNDSYLLRGTLSVPAANGLLLNDRDIDSTSLTASLVTAPQHGQLTLNANGSFSYAPGPSFVFTDSFTYRINDGTAPSNVATVQIEAAFWMTTQNVTVTSREGESLQGFFDVILRIAPGAEMSLAGYEVSLGTANNGIEFLGAVLAPESPVFSGQIPVFSVVDNQLLVTDISPNGPVSLQDGDRLFRAAFQATPAAVGPIPVVFDAQFTNLSDGNGSPLPMANPRGGVITVLDGIAPKVEELSVGGAGWTTSFRDYLATHQLGDTGFAISDDSPQPPRLPFTNIDRISVRFQRRCAGRSGRLGARGHESSIVFVQWHVLRCVHPHRHVEPWADDYPPTN